MIPRHEWFINRMKECIQQLEKAIALNNWNEVCLLSQEIAPELLYATTEWDKYYGEENEKVS